MGIRERAIADTRRITTNKASGAGVDIKIVSRKDSAVTADVVGIHTRHHTSISSDGNLTDDLNAHCSIHEDELRSKGYPVRNAQNFVDIKDDFIYAKDNEGLLRKYKINQVHPDQTMGVIRCILEDCD